MSIIELAYDLRYFIAIALAIMIVILAIFTLIDNRPRKLSWLQVGSPKSLKNELKILSGEDRKHIKQNNFLLGILLTLLVGFFISWLLNNILVLPIILVLAWLSFKTYVINKKRAEKDLIKDQLGPALQALGSAYQAHKNWLVALEDVVPRLQDPIRDRLDQVKNSHQTGTDISKAFMKMQEDLKIPELQLFVTMVQVSEEAGSEVAEGIITAGAYFQQRKIRMQEIANAMMSGLSENRILTYAFIGIVLGFRVLKEDMFRGFTHTLLGQVLLTLYLSIAVICLFVSTYISGKEV